MALLALWTLMRVLATNPNGDALCYIQDVRWDKELFNKEDLLDIEFQSAVNHAKELFLWGDASPVAIILGM
jgi:hypothetical protein